jgi:hypothetical protein
MSGPEGGISCPFSTPNPRGCHGWKGAILEPTLGLEPEYGAFDGPGNVCRIASSGARNHMFLVFSPNRKRSLGRQR